MLSQNYFYWDMTKKYVIAFSHLFSDIHIIRKDASETTVNDITVPIIYAGKRKMYYLLTRNPTISNKISTVLPRMSFLITGMAPDQNRKTNPVQQINAFSETDETITFIYQPVPYNFTIDLVIWAKNFDDLLQVVEQASTFFNPHHILTIKELPELGIEREIPIVLNETSFELETDMDVETDRTLTATMNFTLKGFLYPPIKDLPVIKTIINLMTTKDGITIDELTEEA